MGNFGDVREALQTAKAEDAWRLVLHELDPWFGREPFEVVIEYCKDHLDRWPDEARTFAPVSWFKRDPGVIAADPLTPLFEHALVGRSGYWLDWAAELLEEHKPLKPPKFLDMDALGGMRWRTGEPLAEEQIRRLIVYMRSHQEAGSAEYEQVRQLLNDEDAQRWSRAIHAAWVDAGEKSPHRWALFQIAAFGNLADLTVSGVELDRMTSSGRHARARQYMDIMAAMESKDGLSAMGQFALNGGLGLSTRDHAVEALAPLAKARSMKLFEYMERVLDVHDPISWDPTQWESPEGAKSLSRDAGTLADDLEHAMIIQRGFPWWRVRGHVDAMAKQPGLLWSIEGKTVVRFTANGAVDVKGEAVAIEDGQVVRVAHPAAMSATVLKKWRAALDALGATAPFAQLDRPVYAKGKNEVFTDGDRMPIHPDVFMETAWLDGPFSADYVEERVLMFKGSPWYLEVSHNYRDSYYDGVYGADDGYFIEEARVASVFGLGPHSTRDKVAFSELQLALREIEEVSARLNGQEA